jgi:hypothetical protein
VVVEGPVLAGLVREERRRVQELDEVVLAVEAVDRVRGADAARVEPDDVEPPAEVVVQLLSEAVENELDARAAGAAGIDEDAPDPVRGVGGRKSGKRDLGRRPSRRVVVERHVEQCALEPWEVVAAGLPVDRRRRTGGRSRPERQHRRGSEHATAPPRSGRQNAHDPSSLSVRPRAYTAMRKRDDQRKETGSPERTRDR